MMCAQERGREEAGAIDLGSGALPVSLGRRLRAAWFAFFDPRRVEGGEQCRQRRGESEEALRRARAEAERELGQKDKFITLLGHDLRSSLGAVLSLLELLSHDASAGLSEAHREWLATAEKGARDTFATLEELLVIGRLRIGAQAIERQPVPMRGVLVEITEQFEGQAKRKGIVLEPLDPGACLAHGSRELIKEVARNLVSNAIKFCREGDRITLSCREREEYCELVVADSGPGIPTPVVADLFKYEVPTRTIGSAGEKGSGLGLPLCHDIVRAHGGTLEVHTEAGRGCRFIIKFPRASRA